MITKLAAWFHLLSLVVVVVDSKGVLLIIGGDTGLELGVYNNSDVRTPNLEQLASNGVLFKNAFSSCLSGGSSSRSEILTGVSAHQNGMFGPSRMPSNFRSYDELLGVSKILSDEGVATGIIGIDSLGPDSVYKYDFRQTEKSHDEINISRNISLINVYLRDFLQRHKLDNFFLVLSLGDAQRCAHHQQYGQFCEGFGDLHRTQGVNIPDWRPTPYNSSGLSVPYYVPDREAARAELANMYRSVDRLDQGIGLYLSSLVENGVFATTLVIFTSTAGAAFPGAKYTALDSGMRVPLIIGSGGYSIVGKASDALVSTLDILPTILDHFGLPFPKYSIAGKEVTLTGQSLVPLLTDPTKPGRAYVFSSQNFLRVNEEFPTRCIRNETYKLIWNKRLMYPIAGEILDSPTFAIFANKGNGGSHDYWGAEQFHYLHRSQYELYDFTFDHYEVDNVAGETRYKHLLEELKAHLVEWQRLTFDPWLCSSDDVNTRGNCISYP